MRHAGPPCCRCPFPDAEGYLDTEIGWPVPDDVEPEPPVEITTYGGTRALVLKHAGPYEELSRSYRLMMEALEEHGLVATGDPVEWYESDPQQVPDPKDYVTVIEWPIGPEGEALGSFSQVWAPRWSQRHRLAPRHPMWWRTSRPERPRPGVRDALSRRTVAPHDRVLLDKWLSLRQRTQDCGRHLAAQAGVRRACPTHSERPASSSSIASEEVSLRSAETVFQDA
jgi:GyrI-like small molecule binding protein